MTRTEVRADIGAMVVVDGYAVPKKWTWSLFDDEGVPGMQAPDMVAHFEVRDGRPECVALHITSTKDGRGIHTSDVALFNLEQLTQRVLLDVALPPNGSGGFSFPMDEDEYTKATGDFQELVEGPRRTPQSLLREVARVYLNDRSGAPLNAVALRLGGPEKRRTAARRVAEAREAGLIPAKGAPETEYVVARECLRRQMESEANDE